MAEVDRNQPALIGGLTAGILSVLPVIGAANPLCCCLWALVGGIVTARLLIKRSPQPVPHAEAAKTGAIAGLLAGVMRVFLGLPMEMALLPTQLRVIENLAKSGIDPSLQTQLLSMVERLQGLNAVQRLGALLPSVLVSALLLWGVTVLGSLLGVALFEKRQGQPPAARQSNWPADEG
jgi:hypothetical protein